MESAAHTAPKGSRIPALEAGLHPRRLAVVGAVLASLWLLTDARLAPLILLTILLGLGAFSIRRSVAQRNRSTKENVIVASIMMAGACAWGLVVAGPLFLALPIAVGAAVLDRPAHLSPLMKSRTKRQLVRQ